MAAHATRRPVTNYVISPDAREDLFEIIGYIAAENPAAGDRVYDAIFDAFHLLAERPGAGHSRHDLTDRPVLFWNVMGRYTVVYRHRASVVEIVRLFGPGRDIAAQLR